MHLAVAKLLSDHCGTAAVRSELEWVKALRAGLPLAAADLLVQTLGFAPTEAGRLVISRRTLERRRSRHQPLTIDESVRLARVAAVALSAREVFGNAAARRWLRRPNRVLGGMAPVTLLDTEDGARLVLVILQRLAHGLFS
jgi:putative toxin-antitoxin system antitoxin component (TIGR02293 family)